MTYVCDKVISWIRVWVNADEILSGAHVSTQEARLIPPTDLPGVQETL